MDHRLFEVDVFACAHGVDCGLLVPVVGSGDEDGVHVLAGEDLAVVASGEEVDIVGGAWAPELLAVGEATVVAVGCGDEFYAGDQKGGASVVLALNSCSDEGELEVVACGGWSGLLHYCFCGGFEDVQFGGCGGKAGVLQKSSAIKGHRLRSSVSARTARDDVRELKLWDSKASVKERV